MNWTHEEHKPCFFSGRAEATDWNSLAICYRDYLLKVADTILICMQNQKWDRLFFDFIVSQGRIIAYPHKKGDLIHKRQCEVSIYSPFVLEEYNKIIDSDDYPDDEAANFAIAKLRNRMSMALDKLKNKQDVRQAYLKVREQFDFTAWDIKDGDLSAPSPKLFL